MTVLAAMTLVTASAVAPGPAAVDGLEDVAEVALPALPGPTSVRVHALQALVLVDAPRGVRPLLAALRRSPAALCPEVEETATGAALRCRTHRLLARLRPARHGQVLELAETHGLPWGDEDGPPPLAPPEPEARRGAEPRAELACLAQIRAGDAALARGEVHAATSAWGAAPPPCDRLGQARLCERSWSCATSDRATTHRPDQLPPALAVDLDLRRLRALALSGRAREAVRVLLDADRAQPCAGAQALCRGVAVAALEEPGGDALEAIALWSSLPPAPDGPFAVRAAAAVAAAAERAGAPVFAAQALSSVSKQVPRGRLEDHLLRGAELFLAGGDPTRAGVLLAFARARGGRRGLAGPRWAAVARRVDGAPTPTLQAAGPSTAPARPAAPDPHDLAAALAAADRTVQAARVLVDAQGAHP